MKKLSIEIFKDKEWEGWIAGVVELDVWTQGDTEEDATKNLFECMDLFVKSCYEMGTLKEVLNENRTSKERHDNVR